MVRLFTKHNNSVQLFPLNLMKCKPSTEYWMGDVHWIASVSALWMTGTKLMRKGEAENFLRLWIIFHSSIQFSSVRFSHWVVSDSLQPHELPHARSLCPSPTPKVYSNSCPSGGWCHPTISSSVIPFSCPPSLPASGSFSMSQLFAWGGQSIGVSASASVPPLNTQDWSPSGWTGWISLQSKRLSGVFSNTTVQKHQFFSAQLSSQSISHIHTWPLGKQ